MDNDLYSPPNSELISNTDTAYAGFWRRLGATLIDSLLIVIVTLPLTFMFVGTNTLTDPAHSVTTAEILINYVLPFIVVIVFWKYKSATPGKMILGMKIVDVRDGTQPSLGQFIGRYFAYILSALPLGLGYLWVAWDKRKQAWHDKLAKTAVVRTV